MIILMIILIEAVGIEQDHRDSHGSRVNLFFHFVISIFYFSTLLRNLEIFEILKSLKF